MPLRLEPIVDKLNVFIAQIRQDMTPYLIDSQPNFTNYRAGHTYPSESYGVFPGFLQVHKYMRRYFLWRYSFWIDLK